MISNVINRVESNNPQLQSTNTQIQNLQPSSSSTPQTRVDTPVYTTNPAGQYKYPTTSVTPAVTTDTGLNTTVRRGAYNPDASFQGRAGVNNTPMQGIYIAEETHFAGVGTSETGYKNYGAQAYNLGNLPLTTSNMDVFNEYAPKSWLQNSAPEQLLGLDRERLGIDPGSFENSFVVNAPSFVPPSVRSGVSGFNSYQQMTPSELADYYSHLKSQDGQGQGQPTPYQQQNQSWYDRVDMNKASAGYADLVLAKQSGSYYYNILGSEETAAAYGESAVAAAETGSVTVAGETVGLAELGAEGIAVAGAEAIGGAAVVGAVGASLGLAAAVGFAAYGAYELATGLGAPTLSEDAQYIGDGAKKLFGLFKH